ncbi:hypothetical protein DICPUDRAFT_78858 [Dictyostelium purpureum]|uniref:Peptidase S26 domain-containing protein n=1 Tax=Dictyostelium purpureum TaxID=5786 RepID=F0ZKT5_DICPU|nr:uncharacterized protein DICPUDRAFT_78858 [Dictyostelium purpureum]EGC35415.1 hypothetical protein DICPUDRAFT_78858 [Dictyostelium purpureum]|eukprot:XP_003288028.1 hypothetical protein DICPUDRAFT_78858 [Dictyostelium purpureum]
MIKRLNIKFFKNIIADKQLKFININSTPYKTNHINFNYCYNSNHINFKNNDFSNNFPFKNFNIRFYTTSDNKKDINTINKEEILNNNNNSNNSNNSSNSNSNNNNNNKQDKDYYNSFKNDNANNEFKQKLENEKIQEIKNLFDGRALLMLVVKITLVNYLIRYYILDFTYCQGSSMQPTINSGAVLLINRLTRDFQVNDLVTAISPTTGDYNICKRIKFVEGDTILFHSDTGTVLFTIPKGYVWIEGDNPSTSKDSRSYGPIPKRLLTGKVILRLNPLSLLKDEPPETETQKIN